MSKWSCGLAGRRSVRTYGKRANHLLRRVAEVLESRVHLSADPVAVKLAHAAAAVPVASISSEAPANDNFADATPTDATYMAFSGSTVGATREEGEPGHDGTAGNHSVWWKYTATTSATVEVDSGGSDFDTVLAVYTGSSVDSLNCVASDDDGGDNYSSFLTFDADAGTTYYIALDGFDSNELGSFQLHVTAMVPPANDDFADRIEITSLPAEITGSNLHATSEEQEPYVAYHWGGQSVWWTWTAQDSGMVQLDFTAADFTPLAGVYTGDSLGNLTSVAESADGRLRFAVEAGTTYQIVIDGAWGDAGPFAFTLAEFVPAANDNFADRAEITGTTVDFGGNLSASTLEEGEPDALGDQDASAGSLWWSWTASETGAVSISSEGTDTYMVLAAYTGDSLDNLAEQAWSYNGGGADPAGVTFRVTAGTQYQIVAAGYSGEVTLNLQFWTPPANDDIANRQTIAGDATTVQGTTGGATSEENEPNHRWDSTGHSVWYTWTAPSSGLASFTISSDAFSPTVAVYTANMYTGLQQVEMDDSEHFAAWFQATAGTTYEIAVDSYDGQMGDFTLNLQVYAPPANDNFADRIEITGTDTTVSGTVNAATREEGEPEHWAWDESTLPSTWWTWTAPASGMVEIDANSTGSWMAVVVYTGDSLSELSQVSYGEGYDEGEWYWYGQSFEVTEGTTYQIATVGYRGDFDLHLRLWTPPVNDNFADRTEITGTDAAVTGTVNLTTIEEGEPIHNGWDNWGLGSSWWTWTAPATGTLRISTNGTLDWLGVAVYTGDSLSELNKVSYAEGWDEGWESESNWYWPGQLINVTEGTVYQIATVGDHGEFEMHLQFAPVPANDNFDNAIVIADPMAQVTGDSTGATHEEGEPDHAGLDTSRSVWWSWTAPASGNVQVSMADSDFSWVIAIYTGDSIGSLESVATANGWDGSFIAFDAQEGVTYRIVVDGTEGDGGNFTFSIGPSEVSVTLSGDTVAENSAPGTTVGTLGIDSAAWGGSMAYTLVDGEGGDDNVLFSVDGDSLVVNGELDFETRSTYSARVRAENGSGASIEQVFTINVTDVDDRAAWVIDGTDDADVITVGTDGADYVVKINGTEMRRAMGHVLSLKINGLAGVDVINAAGGDLLVPVTLDGGMGNDTITGSDGADFIRGDGDDDLISGGAGDDTIMGNTGNDTLLGEAGVDLLQGGLGADSVQGGLDDDSLYGGDGSDTLSGDEGNDYIEGKGKADLIHGGAGNDVIWGGAGADEIYGDDGDDTIDRGYYSFSDTIDGGDGFDTAAKDDNDVLIGIEVEDVLA